MLTVEDDLFSNLVPDEKVLPLVAGVEVDHVVQQASLLLVKQVAAVALLTSFIETQFGLRSGFKGGFFS